MTPRIPPVALMFAAAAAAVLLPLPAYGQQAVQESAAPAVADRIDSEAPGTQAATAITGSLDEGAPAALAPAPAQAAPGPRILKSITKRMVLEEPAPLAGMAPVRKQVTITKHLVEATEAAEVPEPSLPLPPLQTTDPAVAGRLATLRAKHPQTEIIVISATVYDHRRTFVSWWPNGLDGPEMAAWSSLDFNLLGGITTYTWRGRQFALLMILGNENTAQRQRLAVQRGLTYSPPQIPVLPADGPGYLLANSGAVAPGALDAIASLHDLYRAEEPRLQAAYAGRERSRIEREAFVRNHPPQPQDVNTWIGRPRRIDVPAAAQPATR